MDQLDNEEDEWNGRTKKAGGGGRGGRKGSTSAGAAAGEGAAGKKREVKVEGKGRSIEDLLNNCAEVHHHENLLRQVQRHLCSVTIYYLLHYNVVPYCA